MATLDRQRDFGTITGDTEGRFYEQDKLYFTADGSPWDDPDGVKPAANLAAKPKAGKTEPKADDQLAEQLR